MWRVLMMLAGLTVAGVAAERKFDFSLTPTNQTPRGFRSTVTGSGRPGEWKVILDEAPAGTNAANSGAAPARTAVLAQLSRDPADDHYPLLVWEEATLGDFTFTTRLKTVAGQAVQMAGVAFRIQDETNYYYVRISTLAGNIRFFKFINGVLNPVIIGQDLPLPPGEWQELTIEGKGDQIRVGLNGRQIIPTLTDRSFPTGKIGFWTMSDSVSYFADARVVYTPLERFADKLLQETLKKYNKLKGLKVYVPPPGQSEPRVLVSSEAAEVGQAGGTEEKECLQRGTVFAGKSKEAYSVMLPLRDRNGEIAAAVRVRMDTFLGQTQDNALARARPVLRYMEGLLAENPGALR